MNLTRREKQIISIGIILLGLIIAFHIFVRPAISRVRTLRRVLPDKQQLLSELISKNKQYNTISRELEKFKISFVKEMSSTIGNAVATALKNAFSNESQSPDINNSRNMFQ